MALPIFARGSYDNIQKNIENGTLKYPTYVVDPVKKVMIFIDKDNEPIILDNNFKVVDSLPAYADADSNVLYYTSDGVYKKNPDYDDSVEGSTEFIAVGDTAAIDALESKSTELENKVTTIEEKTTELETKVEQVVSSNTELVFDTYANFSATDGEDGKLYVDETSEDAGIYSWDADNSTYVKLAPKDSEIKFIELEDTTV